MSKKGVSAAEKRALLQDYFHTTKTFHQARDLERIAQKTLHMKPEVMLEVLEQLVEDGLVRKEKVGSSHFSIYPLHSSPRPLRSAMR